MSNLVDHARYELELIGEEPETIAGYLNIVQAFADMGHSGGSASVAIPTINALLRFKNLKPLTNNPDEWIKIDEELTNGEDLWQSRRNLAAFSKDGGASYTLVESDEHFEAGVVYKTDYYYPAEKHHKGEPNG